MIPHKIKNPDFSLVLGAGYTQYFAVCVHFKRPNSFFCDQAEGPAHAPQLNDSKNITTLQSRPKVQVQVHLLVVSSGCSGHSEPYPFFILFNFCFALLVNRYTQLFYGQELFDEFPMQHQGTGLLGLVLLRIPPAQFLCIHIKKIFLVLLYNGILQDLTLMLNPVQQQFS